jgi:hypothetical protein
VADPIDEQRKAEASSGIHMKKGICWILLAMSWAMVSCHRHQPESVADPASGERKYAIKLSRPSKVGDKFHLHARGVRTGQNTISAGTRTARSTNDVEVELDGNIEVLETDAIHKISKMSCTVETSVVKSNGVSARWPTSGTVIVVERNPSRDKFFINGTPLPDQRASTLSLVLWLNVMAGDSDDLFGTDGLKKVGDSWPYHAERLNDSSSHRTGNVRLVGVTNVNGIACLEIEARLQSTNIDSNFSTGTGKLRSANEEYTFNQLVPVDPARPHIREIGTEKALVTMDMPAPKGPAMKEVTMEVTSERWFGTQ